MVYVLDGKEYVNKLAYTKARYKKALKELQELKKRKNEIDNLDFMSTYTMSRRTKKYQDARKDIKQFKEDFKRVKKELEDTEDMYNKLMLETYKHEAKLKSVRNKRYYEKHKN